VAARIWRTALRWRHGDVYRVLPERVSDTIERKCGLSCVSPGHVEPRAYVSAGVCSRHRIAADPQSALRAVHIGFAWFMPVLYFLLVTPVAMASSGRMQENDMPTQSTTARAKRAKREGKAGSTQAGEFVREEIDRVREGKTKVKSTKQAIAIGLSKARRAGVKTGASKTASKSTKKKVAQEEAKGSKAGAPSPTRSRGAKKALKTASKGRTATQTVGKKALSTQTKKAAKKRTASSRSAAAKKAAQTKGASVRKSAAKKAARTRAKQAGTGASSARKSTAKKVAARKSAPRKRTAKKAAAR
jgi:Uncharacterized C-terminal domain of topoisomerase IA